jgi:hypothetical protein
VLRNRFLDSSLGLWQRRDPIEYPSGANMLEYCIGNPIVRSDPQGLVASHITSFPGVLIPTSVEQIDCGKCIGWLTEAKVRLDEDPVVGPIQDGCNLRVTPGKIPVGGTTEVPCAKYRFTYGVQPPPPPPPETPQDPFGRRVPLGPPQRPLYFQFETACFGQGECQMFSAVSLESDNNAACFPLRITNRQESTVPFGTAIITDTYELGCGLSGTEGNTYIKTAKGGRYQLQVDYKCTACTEQQ